MNSLLAGNEQLFPARLKCNSRPEAFPSSSARASAFAQCPGFCQVEMRRGILSFTLFSRSRKRLH